MAKQNWGTKPFTANTVPLMRREKYYELRRDYTPRRRLNKAHFNALFYHPAIKTACSKKKSLGFLPITEWCKIIYENIYK